MKKILSMILMLAMVLSMGTASVFAGDTAGLDNGNDDTKIYAVNKNTFLVVEKNEGTFVKLQETDYGMKVSCENQKTGETAYFIRNEKNGTIYSSVTGETISINDTECMETKAYSTTEIKDPKSHKISYKTLMELVGIGASAALLTGAICARLGYEAAEGFLNIVGNSLAVINAGIALALDSHGIKVTTGLVKIQRHQGGNVVPAYTRKCVDLTTY